MSKGFMNCSRSRGPAWPGVTLLAGLMLLGGVEATWSAPATNASQPPPPAKSVFVDEVQFGKDPFFPRSTRRAKAVPVAPAAVSAPSLATVILGQLTLKGISVSPNGRYALINNTTLAAGERAELKLTGQVAKIRCVEVRNDSVLIGIEGVNELKELKLKE